MPAPAAVREPGTPAGAAPVRPAPARAGWRWTKRIATLAFFALLAALLWNQARSIEWGEVREALAGYRPGTLVLAAALAAASYTVYSCYDLLSRHYSGHLLPTRQVMGLTFVCYAFNLNLGSLVGGLALRYRLYSRLGLDAATITRIVSFSMATNWLGYLLLAGAAFALQPPDVPPSWRLDTGALRALGGAMIGAGLAYLAACAFARRRSWTLRGHVFALPPLPLALAQVGVSMLNWLLMATIVWLLLQPQRVPYPSVLTTLLVAAVAGVITHVPAGLGVLEAVFVALLSHRAPAAQLVAALLAYRAVYYLAPLALAALAYLRAELRWRRSHPEQRHARHGAGLLRATAPGRPADAASAALRDAHRIEGAFAPDETAGGRPSREAPERKRRRA